MGLVGAALILITGVLELFGVLFAGTVCCAAEHFVVSSSEAGEDRRGVDRDARPILRSSTRCFVFDLILSVLPIPNRPALVFVGAAEVTGSRTLLITVLRNRLSSCCPCFEPAIEMRDIGVPHLPQGIGS